MGKQTVLSVGLAICAAAVGACVGRHWAIRKTESKLAAHAARLSACEEAPRKDDGYRQDVRQLAARVARMESATEELAGLRSRTSLTERLTGELAQRVGAVEMGVKRSAALAASVQRELAGLRVAGQTPALAAEEAANADLARRLARARPDERSNFYVLGRVIREMKRVEELERLIQREHFRNGPFFQDLYDLIPAGIRKEYERRSADATRPR